LPTAGHDLDAFALLACRLAIGFCGTLWQNTSGCPVPDLASRTVYLLDSAGRTYGGMESFSKAKIKMRSYSLDSQAKNSPIKVLLVDDDQNTYLLTRRMLSKMQGPFQIEWAPNYENGLEAIKRKQHDVYLLDYRLGARNGLELLRQAIAAGCKEPIIMLTTENPEVDAEAMKLGAADFLSKDRLDSALLERSIRYSIKQYTTLRALRESEAQLASFMQNVPCAVYMKDLQGRYVYVNETCEKLFHRKSEDWIGQRDDDLWPKQMAQKFKERDHEIISHKRVLESNEIVVQKDGPHHWLTNKFPILNEQGVPIMVGGAAIDITERKRLEKEIQEVSEQEKRRIGQDLHDGLGQYLTGISFMAKVLQQKLAAKSLPEASDAQKISELVNRTVSQTRDLARGLCPVELETSGLQAALIELAASVDKLYDGISCALECNHSVLIYDNATAIHLYRIAQEAVNNAVKHGKASRIVIDLAAGEGTIILTVRDNGCGLPKGLTKSKGMGLRVMNYRAGMIGATVSFEAAPGGGTLVSCIMPNSRKSQKTPAKPPSSKRLPRTPALKT
jgi:PAS domain S-box-containing protein